MLSSLDELEEGFQNIGKKTKEECGDGIEKIRKLAFLRAILEVLQET